MRRFLSARGNATVELGLLLPVLVALLAGTLQGGIVISDQIALQHAASEGLQWAESHPTQASSGDNGGVAQHIYMQLCGNANGHPSSSAPSHFCQSTAPVVHVTNRTMPTSERPLASPTSGVLGLLCNTKPWSLSVSPSAITTIQGLQVQYSVSLTIGSGHAGDLDPIVALTASGLPPATIPSTPVYNPATITTNGSSLLSFSTTSGTPPKDYQLHLNGADQCGVVQSSDTIVDLLVTGTPVPVPSATPTFPTIASLSVSTLTQAGGALNVIGTNFVSGATVSVGSTPATLVTVLSSTTITAVIPAGITPGTYNITVTNPDGSAVTLNNSLTIIIDPGATPSPSPGPPTTTCAAGSGTEFTVQISWNETPVIPLVAPSLPLTATQYGSCP